MNWSQLKARDAQRRKLAIGKAILREGPLTGGRIGQVLTEAGCPVEYPEQYPNVLVQHRFLVSMGTVPRSYMLTPKGLNYVEALIAGEQFSAIEELTDERP